MKYLLQIYSDTGPADLARLSTVEQDAIVGEYLAVSRSPGVVVRPASVAAPASRRKDGTMPAEQ